MQLNREQIIKALEYFHQRILNTNLAEKVTESEMMAIIDALSLIKELTGEKSKASEVAREIFKEFERLMENNEVYFRQTDEMREEFAKLKKKYTESEKDEC